MNRRLIIDGSNMLFRSYWIAENGKSNFEDKYDVGTIYIFLKSLKSVVDIFNPDETWVTWDILGKFWLKTLISNKEMKQYPLSSRIS